MRNTLETRLGLFFALAFVAAVIIFEMIGGLGFSSAATELHARFNNVQELKKGDPVRMAGVDRRACRRHSLGRQQSRSDS